MIDILYLTRGRAPYTRASLPALLANTDWSLVDRLVIYDDASPDHDDSKEAVMEAVGQRGLPPHVVASLCYTHYGSPVAVMNDFLDHSRADLFAKIDNDIIVPPGWLVAMISVLARNPKVRLLGMQADMSKPPRDDFDGRYRAEQATHIGGVGLMRRVAFERFGRPVPDGRFGFTEWQHEHSPGSCWIAPDLRCFELDRLPIEPWRSLSIAYRKMHVNREWPFYPPTMSWYWDWWTP